jgi:hypothetical protein
MNDRVQENGNCSQPPDGNALAILARLERRLARLERLLNDGIGAYLEAKFPYGKATDRWGRR